MQLRLATLMALAFLVAGCDRGPQQLAGALDTAIKAGDFDAAQALFDRTSLPFGQSVYLNVVADCAEEGATCETSTGALTEAMKKENSEQAPDWEWKPIPEGVIDVAMKTKGMQGGRYFEYARVDGQYRIVFAHYSAAKLAELRTMTVQSIADARLAKGVHEPTEPNDPDWKAKASPLPPGGAEAGAWFVAHTKAIAAAVAAGNVSALRSLYEEAGDSESYSYKDKDDKGNPVSAQTLRHLRLRMRATAIDHLQDVTVLGGYQLGGIAALSYEGHDGAGWIRRGCVFLKLDGKNWKPALISGEEATIPPT